jgi:hypothetical protein
MSIGLSISFGKVLSARILFRAGRTLILAAAALGWVGAATFAQSAAAPSPAPPPPAPRADDGPARPAANPRITITVTGGDQNVPIENASVYVKYVEEHKVTKDKKLELNVKTSREGVAHVPNAANGRVLIQVIADGWKTYGRWYDITDPNQEFKIHLERPPKWY